MVRSATDAVKAAMSQTTNKVGTCQMATRLWFDAPSAGDRDGDGDADAVDGWLSEPVTARHSGDRNPPVGAPVAFFGGSKKFGHRAITRAPGGQIRSTDMHDGRWAAGITGNATIEQIEKSMGVTYLGWTETISGLPIPGLMTDKPKPPKPARAGVLRARLYIAAAKRMNDRAVRRLAKSKDPQLVQARNESTETSNRLARTLDKMPKK